MEENENIIQVDNKKNIKSMIAIFVVIFVLFFSAIYIYQNYSTKIIEYLFNQNLTTLDTTPQPVEKRISLIMKKETTNAFDRYYLTVEPISDNSVHISAFQISLLTNLLDQKNIQITPNSVLEKQAWQFPLMTSEIENNNIIIKIAAFRLGNAPFLFDKKTVIATIDAPLGSSIDFQRDNILIYSEDAVSTIPFKLETQ